MEIERMRGSHQEGRADQAAERSPQPSSTGLSRWTLVSSQEMFGAKLYGGMASAQAMLGASPTPAEGATLGELNLRGALLAASVSVAAGKARIEPAKDDIEILQILEIIEEFEAEERRFESADDAEQLLDESAPGPSFPFFGGGAGG